MPSSVPVLHSELAEVLFADGVPGGAAVAEEAAHRRLMQLISEASPQFLLAVAADLDQCLISRLSGRGALELARELDISAPALLDALPSMVARRERLERFAQLAEIFDPRRLTALARALALPEEE